MLTRVQYLRLCVGLPFAGAIVGMVIALSTAIVPMPGWLESAAEAGWMGPLFFAIPYLATVGVLLLALWRRSWRVHVAAAVAAPWFMLVAVLAYPLRGDTRRWVDFVRPVLAVGYFYVGLALLGLFVLATRGYLARE